jgi:hypothetical protein
MKLSMIRLSWKMGLVSLPLVLSAACTSPFVIREEAGPPPIPPTSGIPEDRRVLAGEWDYEDGAVVTLTLDEQGNGWYPWKDGRFVTHSFSDHVWQGIWIQRENDREGGFTVHFSPDFSDGEGQWWYTRIEEDRSPTQKGGTFHLTRKSSASAANAISSAP